MIKSPQVSFYPLKREDPEAELLLACHLAEKAVHAGRRVHLLSASSAQAERLDDLLWQFKSTSFLTHERSEKSSLDRLNSVRITISFDAVAPVEPDVLINLAATATDAHLEYKDIREIVGADDEARQLGRNRYRYYQAKGCPIDTVTV